MNCNEIENLLPAYLEGFLSPEEKKTVAEHLAACPRCGRALADLEQAEKLVKGLAEVEPPPFFEKRIMSRVREEAGRREGFIRRLFYPLHIKVPVQALATIVVAVLAYHVYQQGDPEMKRMAPLPAPLTEQGTGQVETQSPRVPAPLPAARPSEVPPEPAADLPEVKPQPYAAPPSEKYRSREMKADSQAPTRPESPAADRPAAPVMAAKEKDALPPSAEGPGKLRDRAGRAESAGMETFETFSAEPKREKTVDAGAATGEVVRQTTTAPAPARMKAAAIPASAMDLTILVGDPVAALPQIESSLARVNARIVERQSRGKGEFWKVEIAAQNLAQLLGLLEEVGRVSPKTDASALPTGRVTLGITAVSRP